MHILSNWAYSVKLGSLPLIAVVGLATYALFLATAAIVSARQWIKPFRRMPIRFHRLLAVAALVLATFHLLLGISAYV